MFKKINTNTKSMSVEKKYRQKLKIIKKIYKSPLLKRPWVIISRPVRVNANELSIDDRSVQKPSKVKKKNHVLEEIWWKKALGRLDHTLEKIRKFESL